MAISKQEFYEGAAMMMVARTGQIRAIHHAPPFFVLNERLWILLKYSTRSRSPWGFTFTPDEQRILRERALISDTRVALICGGDGVATVDYQSLVTVAAPRDVAVHVACYRSYGEYYEASGPDGTLKKKVSPSSWQRILDQEVHVR